MNNTIHVGGMYGLDSLISGMQKKVSQTMSSLSYQDMLASVQAQAEASPESVGETKSTADMTMDEYKAYLGEKLSAIPWHPNRQNDEESITITDAGWERLKNDPAYEKKLLDDIAIDRSFWSPLHSFRSGSYCTRHIGATEAEYDGWSWSKDHGFGSAEAARKQFEEKSQDSFITIRAKKRKLQAEMDEKYYEQRMMLREISEQYATQRAIAAHKNGVMPTAPEIPITGVPAEFLLAGLMGGGATSV